MRSAHATLGKYLDVRRYTYGTAEEKNQIGQVTGLAWTEVGGELLTIEAVVLPGKGKTITTGKLGEVMQESIQAALSVVRSRSISARYTRRLLPNRTIFIFIYQRGPRPRMDLAQVLVYVLQWCQY